MRRLTFENLAKKYFKNKEIGPFFIENGKILATFKVKFELANSWIEYIDLQRRSSQFCEKMERDWNYSLSKYKLSFDGNNIEDRSRPIIKIKWEIKK